MNDLTNRLISWYLINKRDLPWRNTTEPYHIWLSEIILQQTRVEQGMPYYLNFLKQYPDVEKLAKAPEDEVLKLWQGLGYYSRARNLHATARHVYSTLDGRFPESYKGLKKLKGVGDYTASAIASICFGEDAAVVDGNVYRVLSRIFGIETPINSSAGQREFKLLAQELIDKEDPALFNQAIMEFGAIQCKPKNPYCLHCPFNDDCVALRENTIDQLPVKKGKTKVRERHFNYLVIVLNGQKTIIEQRTGKGIWRGLFQFPLLETEKELDPTDLETNIIQDQFLPEAIKNLFRGEPKTQFKLYNPESIIHKLSHQKLTVKFWIMHPHDHAQELPGIVPIEALECYAVPRVIDRFLERFDFDTA